MFCSRISIFFVLFGIIHCEEPNPQPENSKFDLNLPASITSNFTKALRLRDRNEVHRLLQEKCEENGGPNAFTAAGDAITEGHTCYGRIFDEVTQNEDLQTDKVAVFERVCAKTSQLEGCFDGVAAGIRPCLAANETHYLVDAKTAFHDLLEFACANDAEKISEFLSEDATNCRVSHRDDLERCVRDLADPNDLFNFDTSDVTPDSILQRFFSAERCGKLHDVKSCVVNVLRQCENAVSADIISSVLDIIIRGMPCKDQSPGATRSFSRSHVSRLGH